jgi:hypothetical protein
VWEKNLVDRIVSEDCMTVLRTLVSIPGCLAGLAQHIIPPLTATLNTAVAEAQAAKQARVAAAGGGAAAAGEAAGKLPAMLAESSIDMLGVLLQPGQLGVAAGVAQAALGPALALASLSDDDTLVESASTFVIKLVSRAILQSHLAQAKTSDLILNNHSLSYDDDNDDDLMC